MNRKERIRVGLNRLEKIGVVSEIQIQSSMPGLRWTLTPRGYSTRAMTSNEIEWFILGANAALNNRRL